MFEDKIENGASKVKKISGKELFNKILTGMSIGIVIALNPGALLG